MQRRIFSLLLILLSVLCLSSCATRHGPPAGVTDANTLGSSGGVQSYALTQEDNMVGQDVGPTNGILGKRSFYFAFDSNVVDQKDYPAIQAHGHYLLNHPNARVLLEGNTDSRGSREYNVALGQRRADAVANILRMQGVPAKQVRTISYGEEKPVALGHTESAYRLNRRVDIRYEAN